MDLFFEKRMFLEKHTVGSALANEKAELNTNISNC